MRQPSVLRNDLLGSESSRDVSGHDFPEWPHFEPAEDALHGVGVAANKRLGVGFTLHVDDHQAAGAVGERTTDDQTALFKQRFKIFQMGRTDAWPQPRAVGSVITNDYEEHSYLRLPRAKLL